jgi:hypothetical protein
MGEARKTYTTLVWKPYGKPQRYDRIILRQILVRGKFVNVGDQWKWLTMRREDNIKMDLC